MSLAILLGRISMLQAEADAANVAWADGYLWGFFQGGVLVWENLRDQGTLFGTDYALHYGQPGYDRLAPGPVQVMVRSHAGIEFSQDATIITINLRP
jgi:hypothetical protein